MGWKTKIGHDSPPFEKSGCGIVKPPCMVTGRLLRLFHLFADRPPRSKTLQETRLLLIRHAETAAPQVFHGAESDVALSPWGHRQAVLLGDDLRTAGVSALYSSAMVRALATSGPIGKACGLDVTVIPELHERKIGPLSGLSREAGWDVYAESKRQWIAGNLEFTHEGGESFADIQRRVLPVIERLAFSHPGQTLVVVAHGIVIRVLLLSLLAGMQPGNFDRIAIDFASINDLRWDGRRWRAVALNQVIAPSTDKPMA
jgi:broad specificity phosphatase PhoE